MKALILYFLRGTFGKKRMQRFYESLFRVSLYGMNYGNGGDYRESGELKVVHYIKEKLRRENSILVFDVGANVGKYSTAVAKVFGEKANIHCFEPSQKTYESLVKNTSHLKNIKWNNVGIGEVETNQLLYSNRERSGFASLYHRELDHIGISMTVREEIKLSTIDKYCSENKIERVHFLKLDIEGHELSALKGAHEMLTQKKIDFIQFEFGGTSIDSRTYFRDFYNLLKNDFIVSRIVKDGLIPIRQYKIGHEIFEAINFLAERVQDDDRG